MGRLQSDTRRQRFKYLIADYVTANVAWWIFNLARYHAIGHFMFSSLEAYLTSANVVMGQVLEKYLARYPQARIHMEVENTHDLLVRLDEGRIDFALVEGFFKKTEYDFQIFSREKYIAVCSPDYTFCDTPDCIEKLFQERLLLREEGSGTREVLERCLEAHNLSIQDFAKRMEVGSMQTIKELTKAGCGITFLYEAAVRRELEDGSLRQIPLRDFPVVHEFAFIWRRGSIYAEWYRELFRRFSA